MFGPYDASGVRDRSVRHCGTRNSSREDGNGRDNGETHVECFDREPVARLMFS